MSLKHCNLYLFVFYKYVGQNMFVKLRCSDDYLENV